MNDNRPLLLKERMLAAHFNAANKKRREYATKSERNSKDSLFSHSPSFFAESNKSRWTLRRE
jgi:hypothetical protein